MRVGVGVGVAGVPVFVGVCVAHAPAAKHAACRTGAQFAGHPAEVAAEQTSLSHSQQSFGPYVAVGVGVCVAHAPADRHAAWRTGAQLAGHPAEVAAEQTLFSHWQQSFGP